MPASAPGRAGGGAATRGCVVVVHEQVHRAQDRQHDRGRPGGAMKIDISGTGDAARAGAEAVFAMPVSRIATIATG